MNVEDTKGATVETVAKVATEALRPERKRRVLVVTAVDAEREAVLRGIGACDRFDVIAGGVGTAAVAVSTAKALVTGEYAAVVSAGIAGGFIGQADVGTLTLASEIVAADLGAETAEGFCSLDELGFGLARIAADAGLTAGLAEKLRSSGVTLTTGPVLTVSTVTGTAETAAVLAERVPGAVAEAMEGYGVAWAARDAGLPVVEIRAISNPVGPRDRAAWRIKEALDMLESASRVLPEVL